MKTFAIICLAFLLVRCANDTSTINNFLSDNHIDGKVVENVFIKNVTALDSMNYYRYEFMKIVDDSYPPKYAKSIEAAISYKDERLKMNKIFDSIKKKTGTKEFDFILNDKINNDYKYASDKIILEVIKREKDKYESFGNKILCKLYRTTIKIDGIPFPKRIEIALSNDDSKVLRVFE